jgi:nicotinamide-nucleotide amidase
MKAEIITIGTELLIGQVTDTNSAWMGRELNKAGYEVSRITTVGDVAGEIKTSIGDALSRVSIVLVTGGLGPTKDDITKHTLCDLFSMQLRFDEKVYDDVVRFLKGRVSNINGLNRSQAMVPDGCTIIRNPVGTAPILWFDAGEKVVVCMPGVPSEMEHAMVNEIIPRLGKQFQRGVIIHKTVMVAHLPESVLAEKIAGWEDSLDESLSLAYLPSPGIVKLRITGRGDDSELVSRRISDAIESLRSIVGSNIISYVDEPVQHIIGRKLASLGKTVATAESCTGGYISHLITTIPGSSVYFKGGVVAYSNSVKADMLGVDPSAIERHGAVSLEVVEQMAHGVRKRLGADYGIATSGIAGPGGGSEEKPVGTVCIALATPEGIFSKKYVFGSIRERNILRSGETALILLLQYLNGDLSITA